MNPSTATAQEAYSYGTYSFEDAELCNFDELQPLPCGRMLHFGVSLELVSKIMYVSPRLTM